MNQNSKMRMTRQLLAASLALLVHVAAASAPLAWSNDGRPTALAREAIALLEEAPTHGLDPVDYDAARLAQSAGRLARPGAADPAAVAVFDRHLTAAMTRFLADLHHGRIAPDQLPHGYLPATRATFDAEAALRRALAAGRLDDAVKEAAPRLAQYDRLREALAQYRALAGHPAWKSPLPPLPPGSRGSPPKLEPGQPYAGAPLLRDRLAALGDLPASTATSATYDEALAEGVRAFQQRHGLATDGVIGKATFAQLQVPPVARARQIELMLERLRWTPLMQGRRMVVINIPEFVLRAYEVEDGRIAVAETMKVIVGKALNTRTPLFVEQMRLIEFQPFWNVPPSIARGEVVPRLRRDPGYWDREGFEFVVGGRVATELSAALLDETIAGRARIRQRPGPKNALGDIKFVFPNNDNIYLHHTPSVRLFERDRRDFSHGCIRVEEPVALALFVMQGMPGWTEDRIRRAMGEDDPVTVRLAEPLPVLIAYGTAMVKAGRVHFFDDIYGHDRHLDAALRQPRPAL
ncbi:MAG: L,D-transpeptidase family protein [Betaproteobacteria bacterium]